MGVPSPTIRCGDQVLDPTISVLGIEVHRALNRVPEATLTLAAEDSALRPFALSDAAYFEPGKPVSIALRSMGDERDTPVFQGLVVRHAIERGVDGSTLRVELKDAAFKLTRPRRTAVWRDTTDSDAMAELIQRGGLRLGAIDSTRPRHVELIQYNATDWDFLVSRADVLGLVVNAHLGAVSVSKVALDKTPIKLDLSLGQVDELSLELDGASQWAEVESVGWDPPELAPTAPERAANPGIRVANLDPAGIARALGGEQLTLLHGAPFQPEELRAWASARLLKSRLALLRGRVSVPGDASLSPLDVVELVGVGARFNGSALVSAVTHRIDERGWSTELTLGLSPEWFAREPDIADAPAGGLLPPVRGLQIATVDSFQEDASGALRVKVKLPSLTSQQGSVWARLALPDAGPERGFAFRPEPGDEVVLGFLDDDPRQAVILGALHGEKNAPPKVVKQPDEKNALRAIVSRAGARIVFDDAERSLTIEDEHGNVFTMDKDGITLKSAGKFTIDARGDVIVKGTKVDLQ